MKWYRGLEKKASGYFLTNSPVRHNDEDMNEPAAKPLFNSSLGIKLGVLEVVQAIHAFINAEPERRYKITIGTDSERYGGHSADFVTAIVVHRVGNGGRFFWRHIPLDNIHTLRNRMYQEVLLSLDAAKELVAVLKDLKVRNFDFEIPGDVGENGETRTMIQELVGMVRANNFEAKTKPDSYAASSVADKYTGLRR